MRWHTIIAAILTLAAGAWAQSTTQPATETLLNGRISFTPPDNWKLALTTKDGQTIAYTRTRPEATIAVNVVPQERVLDAAAQPTIGQTIVKQIRDHAAAEKTEFLMPPRAEPDDRFFLRIHDRYRQNNQVGEQLQIYRVVGLNLAAVAVRVSTDSPDEAKIVFEEAEKTLLSIQTGGGQAHGPAGAKLKPATRPTILTAAKLSLSPPAGWRAEISDQANGVVARFFDPAESASQLMVVAKPLPATARTDAKARDAVIDQMVKSEKADLKLEDALEGGTTVVKDTRFLRKERSQYKNGEAKLVSTGRQIRVGEQVVSVVVVSPDASAADLEKLGDAVAVTVRPTR